MITLTRKEKERQADNIPTPGWTLLRYAAVYIWVMGLFVAMINSYFLEASSAILLSLVLVYLYARKQNNRVTFLKRRRKQSEKYYQVNEDYLRIFSAEK